MYIGDAPLGYLGQGGFAAVLPEGFVGPPKAGDVAAEPPLLEDGAVGRLVVVALGCAAGNYLGGKLAGDSSEAVFTVPAGTVLGGMFAFFLVHLAKASNGKSKAS